MRGVEERGPAPDAARRRRGLCDSGEGGGVDRRTSLRDTRISAKWSPRAKPPAVAPERPEGLSESPDEMI
jgi:hypothetical protein